MKIIGNDCKGAGIEAASQKYYIAETEATIFLTLLLGYHSLNFFCSLSRSGFDKIIPSLNNYMDNVDSEDSNNRITLSLLRNCIQEICVGVLFRFHSNL